MYEYKVFISYAEKDVAVSLKFKEELEKRQLSCFHHIDDSSPGASIAANIQNGVKNSETVLLLISEDFLDSKWAHMEIVLGVLKTKDARKMSCVCVHLTEGIERNPKYPRSILAGTGIQYQDTDQFWEDLKAKISEDNYVDRAVPQGDIAHGLAWNYYYGFLNIVLPDLKKMIQDWKPETDTTARRVETLFVVIPKSCEQKDKKIESKYITELKPQISKEVERAGNPKREFKLQMYKIQMGDGEEVIVNINRVASVQSMREMMNENRITPEHMELQRELLELKLKQIVNNPGEVKKDRTKCMVLGYDDSNDANLPKLIMDECKKLTE